MTSKQKKESLVVVTGMHRSGTSALAKTFVDLGYDPGRNLIPAAPDNPEGFWEDAGVINLNDRLLDRLCLNWSTIEDFEDRRIFHFLDEIVSAYLPDALNLIANKFEKSPAILIKDPRISILLPFWNRVFEHLEAKLFLFHIYRNPLSVAKSLQERNGIALRNGALMWYYYNLAFFSDAKHQWHNISYQKMLEQTEKTIKTIVNIADNTRKNVIASSSIKPELNHHPVSDEPGSNKAIDLPMIQSLWKLLKRMENNPAFSYKEMDTLKEEHLTSHLINVENEKIVATLLIHDEKGEHKTPFIISKIALRNDLIRFDLSEEVPAAKMYSIYLNDKFCRIKVDRLEIFASNEVFRINELSGNFISAANNGYLFDSNSPHFEFVTPYKIKIEKVLLAAEIYDLEYQDFSTMLAILKNDNLLLRAKSHKLQKQMANALTAEAILKDDPAKLQNRNNMQQENITVLQKENLDLQGRIEQQINEIGYLEKKSLWLYNEFNKAKDSISWKVTAPLRAFQQWLNSINSKLFILTNDIGASIFLLRREGPLSFLNRLVWYVKGKRLKEEIEFAKKNTHKQPHARHIADIQLKPVFFKLAQNPKVSIIIPVFNNYGITYRCLNSIHKNSSGTDYELIIVDDRSTMPEYELEKIFIGVNVIRNNENIGFLRSCNKAAATAKGEYICILNNDTEVHPGWIEQLLGLLDANCEIGMAGPKLVYPDGSLQEAGGIIWKDASAWNYGRYDDAEKPDYNYIKEVDYISGACFLVRRYIWNRLGGFDEYFAPAYYEDTDLAMQVRKAGYKVYYQPLSVVTHYEGISNGLDESKGVKKFQAINREKFFNKWEHELSVASSPNGINVFFHRDRSLCQKHLLIIDHYVPMYDKDAGSRSTFSYLKLLVKMGFKIHFIGDNYFKHEPYTTALQKMGIEVLYGSYYQKNIRDWFRENGRYIEFVVAHRIHIAPKYFDMIRKFTTAKIAYVGHDLQYMGSLRKFEITGDKAFKKESAKFLKTETRIFTTVDIILPFSTYEEPYIKKMAQNKTVQVIPVYFFDNTPEKIPGFDERHDILFVGYFGHPPNPDAILWFVKEIFPLVQQKVPDAKLHVVGSQPNAEVLGLQNDCIKVTGYVSDQELTKYYRNCKVAILPLRFGAGVKGKLLESLNHQIPTVITPVAAEGVPEIEHHSLIAESPNDFAENISLLYQDKNLWEKYSAGGKDLIEKHYTEEVAGKLLEKVFLFKENAKL